MLKTGKKGRDIKFFSRKNDAMVMVHSSDSYRYAVLLEERDDIGRYEAGRALDSQKMKLLNRIGIRKEYLDASWETDFYIENTDGSVSVREITTEKALSTRAEAEKLELSRRFWTDLCGVHDWKVVIMRGGR
ncbi:MAG: hypothetical protein Q4E54_00285 [Lachnospiraceae bacterium]|nr:hypothetical protein [Lachnospiraceae bacterium]